MTVSYDDQDIERLLTGMPAPGVPPRTKERHLDMLRAAMAADLADGSGTDPVVDEPADKPPVVVSINRPRRRRMVVAVVAAAAVGLGATAAATIAWERASNRTEVRCFPAVVTDYDNPEYGDTMSVDSDSASAALDICAGLWREGDLVSTRPYIGSPSPLPQPVPSLVACVLPSGEVGVFPTAQTCEDLGLPRSSG